MEFGDRLGSMWAYTVAYLPQLLGAIVILIVGWIVAKLLESATETVLEKTRFDMAVDRGGVRAAIARTGSNLDPSSLVARLVFWIVFLVAILMAANALGLTAVANMFERLVAYIPNVIVAVLIIVMGMVIGEFVKDLILASVGSLSGVNPVAHVAKVAIMTLAIFMALDQLGIARNIVVTAFTLILGAVALAAGLAFGLGNRELAGEYMRRWVERAENATSSPKRVGTAARVAGTNRTIPIEESPS
jgi:small-conductance mechanosensitive channel